MTFYIIAYRDVRIGCNGCSQAETTTKDIFCNSTVVDVYYGIIDTAFSRSIGCLVTTAIDAVVNSTAIDIDCYRILRSTIIVITAKHVVDSTTSHCNSHRTEYVGSITICHAQAATKDIAFVCARKRSSEEVDMSFFSGCYSLDTAYQMRIYLTLCAAAIDITGDFRIPHVVMGRSRSCISTNIYCYITCHMGRFTIAATENVAINVNA